MKGFIKCSVFLSLLCFLGVSYADKSKEARHHAKAEVVKKIDKISAMIHVNSADKKELMSLKGVGKKTAENIIAYREKNGKFKKMDELSSIHGMSQAKLEKIVKENKLSL